MSHDHERVEQLQRYLRDWDPNKECPFHEGKQHQYDDRGNLSTLHLCGRGLSQVPSEVWQCSALQKLYLDNNRLSLLSSEVSNLSALQWLSLSENQLATLPSEVFHLTALHVLELRSNRLRTLPADVGNLSALQWLNLSENQLTTLPAEVFNLAALEDLGLHHNQLQLHRLPMGISRLTALKSLDLRENQLTTFSAEVGRLSTLQSLYFSSVVRNARKGAPVRVSMFLPGESIVMVRACSRTPLREKSRISTGTNHQLGHPLIAGGFRLVAPLRNRALLKKTRYRLILSDPLLWQ